MLKKSHPLSRYKTNGGKNPKKKCLMHFDPDLRSLTLAIGTIANLYLFDSIFSVIVRTNRLHGFDEGICFPENCCSENG